MGFYDAIRIGASGAADSAFTVDRSLRINKPDDPQLYRTGSNNASTYTISMWIKISGSLSNYRRLFSSYADGLILNNDGRLRYEDEGDGQAYSTAVFRDTSAWYHIVMAVTPSGGTVYVNNVSHITSSMTHSLSTASNAIRHFWNPGDPGEFAFDGYGAEVALIDGQALTPSSFAETNAETGQWIPKDLSGLTFGSNGHYLKFTDTSNLGKDFSGNNNNFTTANFSTSAGAGNDSLEDTPTNNFCTLNPLAGRGTGFLASTNGSLDFAIPAGGTQAWSSFQIPTSGKWYAEWVFTTVGSGAVGVGNVEKAQGSSAADQLNGINMLSGEIRVNDSATQSSLTAIGNNDIVGIKVDRDAGTVAFTINGSAVGNAENISSMNAPTDLVFRAYRNSSGGSTPTGSVNYGQRPFSNLPTGYKALNSANLPDPTILLPNKHFETVLWTGNSASGGSGTTQTISGLNFAPDWLWIKSRSGSQVHSLNDTVRGVNKQLNSASSDAETTYTGRIGTFNSDGFILGADGDVNYNGYNYVGWNWNAGDTDGKTYTVTVVDSGGNKYRFDGFAANAVTLDLAEGGTYIFNYPSAHPLKFSTTADGTHGGGSEYTTGVTHNSSTQVTIVVAASAPTLYYYCGSHSGMGGQVNTNSTLGSSNFDGTTQSTAKVNASAGFSIVTYTGTGSNATIGHGLGVAPQAAFFKRRDSSGNWMVYHQSLGNTHNLYLNTSNASQDDSHAFNDTSPTSSVFTLGISGFLNASSGTYVGFIFSEVAGYSKFGSYTGNGNADGTFVFTGFRPAWVLIKNSSSGSTDWILKDATIETFNVVDAALKANTSEAEASSLSSVDFLSNGFKIKNTGSFTNTNGNTYIYLAFAESPFKNARAR